MSCDVLLRIQKRFQLNFYLQTNGEGAKRGLDNQISNGHSIVYLVFHSRRVYLGESMAGACRDPLLVDVIIHHDRSPGCSDTLFWPFVTGGETGFMR